MLGPAESFRWLGLENAAWSSLVRDTLRRGLRFDKQLAMRQHREMVDAYEQAGVTCHYLPVDENAPYQVYTRDSSFMSPYGAVICQLANPRRRGEYASVLRFYLEKGIPVYDMVSAGNFEGGDFNIIHHGAALVGYTDHRSERVAAEQVADWFLEEGWEIKYAPIDSFYVHIDLMVCMLNEHCAAVCLDTTPEDIVEWLQRRGIEILPATFKETMALGCNVVALGQDRVLSTSGRSGPQRKDARRRLHRLRPGHDDVHLGRRRRALHVPAPAPRGGLTAVSPKAPPPRVPRPGPPRIAGGPATPARRPPGEPTMTSSSKWSGIKLNRPFVGIPSFLRAPIETDLDVLDADIAVYGVPFDEGSPFLAGSRMGPRSIREHSLRFAASDAGFYDPETRRTYLAYEMANKTIAGRRRCRRMAHRREEHVRQRDRPDQGGPRQGALPVVLGGDHSVTYPIVKGYEDQEPLHVIHFDAHIDYAPFIHDLRFTNTHTFRHIAPMQHVLSLTQVGIRSLRSARKKSGTRSTTATG